MRADNLPVPHEPWCSIYAEDIDVERICNCGAEEVHRIAEISAATGKRPSEIAGEKRKP